MTETAEILNVIGAVKGTIAELTPGNPVCFGCRSYSQCDEEDGIIRECLARISGTAHLSKTFLEIGCGDGLENNRDDLSASPHLVVKSGGVIFASIVCFLQKPA